MTLRPGARTPRRERVAEQLREEISALMLREMKDPRVRLASITRVTVSPDLREARLLVSTLNEGPDREAAVDALRHAEGFLRAQLGTRLENLRTVPHLRFDLDESIAYAIRVSSLLRDLAAEPSPATPVEVPE